MNTLLWTEHFCKEPDRLQKTEMINDGEYE